MAIIYSYPTVVPTTSDLILGTDTSTTNQATKNFTVQSILDLFTVVGNDLQAVLDFGNIATGRDIILGTETAPTQTVHAGTFTTGPGSAVIVGAVGIGFTDFTSTRITGTIQAASAAQTNITSLGTLTSLSVNTSVTGTAVVTTLVAPGDNLKIASTKAIVDYIALKPNKETLAETLATGNVTGGTDIAVSAGDDITFTDTSKILMGAGNDLEIYHDSSHSYIKDTGTGDLTICGSTIVLNNAADNANMITATEGSLVRLFHNGQPKLITETTGINVTGVVTASVGSNGLPSYIFGTDTNTGMFHPGEDEIGFSTNGSIRVKISDTGVNITGITESDSFTTDTTLLKTPMTRFVKSTDGDGGAPELFGIAAFPNDTMVPTNLTVKNYADTVSGAKTLSYKDTSATVNIMNLDTDDLQFTGGSNITSTATAVALTIADIKFDLDNSIVLTGQVKADNFTTTAGTATWATTVLDGFTSITSTAFVGELTGNASTATALASAGAITLLGDTTGGPNTYTSGGAVNLTTAIADSVVYNKTLAGFNATTGSVQDGDSIIEALERLQGQITTLPQGLVYQGIWSAVPGATGGGTPDLTDTAYQVNGHFYICDTAGVATPNGTGTTPNDWDVRDWVIFADDGAGGGVDEWQKIDNSSLAGGSGTTNTITKWTNNQTIGNSTITDDGSTVTIANTVDFIVQGNATLGNAASDTAVVKGPLTSESLATLSAGLNLTGGIDVGGTYNYGTAGQVLTNQAGTPSATQNLIWADPTVGTVTSVGLTETGDALTITNSPITSTGNINIAGAGASTQYINGELNLVTFPTVDNYVSWTADSDEGTDITVTSGFNLKFTGAVTAGGAGIATDSAVSANEMTIGLINAGGTPGATTFYRGDGQWSVPVGTKTETLAEVLVNGNTTGSTDISVTSANIVFQDSSAGGNGRALFGATQDLQIFHDGSNSYIIDEGTGDLTIRASNDLRLQSTATEAYLTCNENGSVQIYYNNAEKFATTTAGINVTGQINANTGSILKGSEGLYLSAGGDTANGRELQFTSSTNNGSQGAKHTINAPSGNGMITLATSGLDALTINQSQNATFTGNVEIDGNLTVDGAIIHGGSGGGTAKGGTFTKLYTTGTVAAGAATAFTINRSGTGAMVFDVMLTSDTSTACAVAKKYTVVSTYGNSIAPIYNKILDTGPDGSNDFNIVFAKDGTADTRIKCTIAAVGLDSQKIGITIDLGFGQNDATIVMN